MLWWIELDLVSLKGSVFSISEFGGVDGFGMALGSLFFNAQGFVPALLENYHCMSCPGTC